MINAEKIPHEIHAQSQSARCCFHCEYGDIPRDKLFVNSLSVVCKIDKDKYEGRRYYDTCGYFKFQSYHK